MYVDNIYTTDNEIMKILIKESNLLYKLLYIRRKENFGFYKE